MNSEEEIAQMLRNRVGEHMKPVHRLSFAIQAAASKANTNPVPLVVLSLDDAKGLRAAIEFFSQVTGRKPG